MHMNDMATIKAPTRPVLRWHGGKWKLAPWIISHFPKHRIYVEPFGGAASVLLSKPRTKGEVYNDLDECVVGLFRVLQDPSQAESLIGRLRHTPFARAEFERARYPSADPVDQAWALIVRCFMGYGTNAHAKSTGFRSNSMRSNTTPAVEWTNYPDALTAIAARFMGVVIERRDAKAVMAGFDDVDCLHYVDPPYLADTRDRGSDYAFELTTSDHVDLLKFVQTLCGMVVLSGYPSPLYDETLPDWTRIEIPALADGARPRTEVLWLNPACVAALDSEHGPLFAAGCI